MAAPASNHGTGSWYAFGRSGSVNFTQDLSEAMRSSGAMIDDSLISGIPCSVFVYKLPNKSGDIRILRNTALILEDGCLKVFHTSSPANPASLLGNACKDIVVRALLVGIDVEINLTDRRIDRKDST